MIASCPHLQKRRKTLPIELFLILSWWLLVLILGLLKTEYSGEAVRHLGAIDSPTVGESRWTLHPYLVFVIHKLFALLFGSLELNASQLLLLFNSLCGLSYLLSLRGWLRHESREQPRIAPALLLAGSATPLFMLSQDFMEPLPAAALSLFGLYLAVRIRERHPARSAYLIALFSTLASLFYQALLLSALFLPCVVP